MFLYNDIENFTLFQFILDVDKILGSAISHHLQHNKPPTDGKMILQIER